MNELNQLLATYPGDRYLVATANLTQVQHHNYLG